MKKLFYMAWISLLLLCGGAASLLAQQSVCPNQICEIGEEVYVCPVCEADATICPMGPCLLRCEQDCFNTVAICGNRICEAGEESFCPACIYANPPCAAPCYFGTCPQDCTAEEPVGETVTETPHDFWYDPAQNLLCHLDFFSGNIFCEPPSNLCFSFAYDAEQNVYLCTMVDGFISIFVFDGASGFYFPEGFSATVSQTFYWCDSSTSCVSGTTCPLGKMCFDNLEICQTSAVIDCPTSTSCGDGWINDPGEECDDGNLLNGDGCSEGCRWKSDTYLNGDPYYPGPY